MFKLEVAGVAFKSFYHVIVVKEVGLQVAKNLTIALE